MSQILTAFEQLSAERKPAAIATVVAVGGSSYRRPGARMLVATDGRTWGGISGGCLERDVARRARAVIETGEPVLCRYDTTESLDDAAEESGLLDLGHTPGRTLGCRGVIDLFIDRISSERPGPIPLIARAVRERTAVTVATLLRASPGVEERPGTRFPAGVEVRESDIGLTAAVMDRLLACEAHGFPPLPPGEGRGEGELRAPHVEIRTSPPASPHPSPLPGEGERQGAAWNPKYGSIHHVVLADGHWADVFVETVRPPPSLVIFGGGSDVVPLLDLAKTLGWHVTIVAGRTAVGARERFATADVFASAEGDDPLGGIDIEPGAAVVLMTHDFRRDAKILAALSGRSLRYLGLLGPRNRSERLLAQVDGSSRWNAFYPVGLDLGADSPELIALAMVSEIQAVLAGRPGGMLRDRPGPIYPRAQKPT